MRKTLLLPVVLLRTVILPAQVPTIPSFTPTSGPAGTMVNITGRGFSPAPAENIVYFGAVKAPVIAASPTTLTVTAPAGATYQPITVTVNGLTGYSNQPFVLTFPHNCVGFYENSFAPKIDYTTGPTTTNRTAINNVAIGDLDGDGKPDLVVDNAKAGIISVFQNVGENGTVAFTDKTDLATNATNPFLPNAHDINSVTIADVDGDGKPDLAVANTYASSVSVFHNTSTSGIPSFARALEFVVGVLPAFVPKCGLPCQQGSLPVETLFRDLDGDGKPDLVVINSSSGRVSIRKNLSSNGMIAFAPYVEYVNYAGPAKLAICDLDGDGKPDLVVAGNYIAVFKNTSSAQTISFGDRMDFAINKVGPSDVAIGDLDGDGKPDLVIAGQTSDKAMISIMKNRSSGGLISFAPEVGFVIPGDSPSSIAIGDLDGDGKPDLAVTNKASDSVSVFRKLREDGLIEFAPAANYSTGAMPSDVAIGDLDGDGKPDLAIANTAAGSVSVLRSQIACPVPCTPPTFLNNSSIVVDIGCSQTKGSISVIPLTGTSPFQYSIDNGSTYVAGPVTGYTFNQLSPGMYGVRLKDANGCESVVVQKEINVNCQPVPVITSFIPASGPVGTLVTLTGTNFGSTPSENIVYFGAVQAPVVSASPTSLTVTAPAGTTYQSITVTAKHATAYTNKPFVLTFSDNCEGFRSNSFAEQMSFPLTERPSDVAAGDFDGDGKTDLVETNENAQVMAIFRNVGMNGNVAFDAGLQVSIGKFSNSVRIAVGDLDRDGKLDIAVAFGYEDKISVFRNNSSYGQISFDSPKDYVTGYQPTGIAIGDLDGDGKPDIAVSLSSSPMVSVFRNTGSPGTIEFASRVDVAAGSGGISIAMGDLNNDSKTDLVVGNGSFNNKVSVLKNMSSVGSIDFAPRVEYQVDAPVSVAVGDIDGDGKADIIAAHSIYLTPALTVLKNISMGDDVSFGDKVDYPIGYGATQVKIHDLNGDSKPDIAVTDDLSNAVFIIQNKSSIGTINLSDPIGYATGYGPKGLTIADFTQDGKPDLATANGRDFPGSLSILKNIITQVSCHPQALNPPVISSSSPSNGPVGGIVVISGANFDPLPSNNTVYFGAVKAAVINATSTALTIIVPSGTTYQPISVTTGQLTDQSSQPFIVTFSKDGPDEFVANSFSAIDSLQAPKPTGHPIFSDIDGDGKPDLTVLSSVAEGKISIYRNTSRNANISFADKNEIISEFSINDFTIHDLDGDGKPDLAYLIQSFDSSTIYILKNTSTSNLISFAEPVQFGSGVSAFRLSVHDIDNDGRPDILLDNYRVLMNKSEGKNIDFDGGVIFPKLAGGRGLFEIADVDGDRKEDFIALDNYKLSVFRNSSNREVISFEPTGQLVYSSYINSLALSDLDGDGMNDLIGSGLDAKEIVLTRNASSPGTISFAETVVYKLDFNPLEIAVSDLDGDGKPDLTVLSHSDKIAVFKNISTPGHLALDKKVDFVAGVNNDSPYRNGPAIGDLDGDGKPEIAVPSYSSGTVIIQRNQIGEIPCITPTFRNDATIVLDANCSGNGGLISLTPALGTAPFQYSIDGGATYVEGPSTGYSFQNLSAGTYDLRLKDANGCESAVVTKEVRRYYGGPLFRNDGTIVLDASCAGNDGNISIIPTCGAAPFQYSIDGGRTYVDGPATGYTFQNLSAGSYPLRLKDFYGNESTIVTREVKANAFSPCATIDAANSVSGAAQLMDAALARAYPNPNHGRFQVQLSRLSSPRAQLQVVDARGVVLQSRTVNSQQTSVVEVDLSSKASGLYLIRIVSDKGVQQTKVMIQ